MAFVNFIYTVGRNRKKYFGRYGACRLIDDREDLCGSIKSLVWRDTWGDRASVFCLAMSTGVAIPKRMCCHVSTCILATMVTRPRCMLTAVYVKIAHSLLFFSFIL